MQNYLPCTLHALRSQSSSLSFTLFCSCPSWNYLRSAHLSKLRDRQYLRKNMRAPDRALLYLRGTRAKYISSTIQLIDINTVNTVLDVLDGHLRTDSYHDVPARLADCPRDAVDMVSATMCPRRVLSSPSPRLSTRSDIDDVQAHDRAPAPCARQRMPSSTWLAF